MTRPSTGTSTGIFFPDLGSYQAFARQCAALSLIKQRILEHLFPASGDIHLLDGFPIPPWLANDANSRWIGPNNADELPSGRVVTSGAPTK